ncbi:hypothetical protein [Collimonas fungivorans]|uniref:hypothetical protein n=1 Tax=Collimonas fungivorans TaxID=158899 RepID=UPI003FA35A40
MALNQLSDVVPREKLAKIFGADLTFEEHGMPELAYISKKKPDAVNAIGGNVWSRIVHNKWVDVDPTQLADYFDRVDPKLHRAISKVIGEDVIRDIYYARAFKGVPRKANLVMEILLADVYNSDLQLGDITFCNPDKPIARAERRFPHQTHHGLGLLSTLVDNMNQYALSRQYRQLTLTAASLEIVSVFSRHGFEVEDSKMGRLAMRLGGGIPMERNVTG